MAGLVNLIDHFSLLLICIIITTFCGLFSFYVYDIAMVFRKNGHLLGYPNGQLGSWDW